jgi:hypothetical protein
VRSLPIVQGADLGDTALLYIVQEAGILVGLQKEES